MEKFYNIDFKIKNLIESILSVEKNKSYIRNQISNLNEFQFYYVLNSVLSSSFSVTDSKFLGLYPSWENLNMFFDICHSDEFDFKVISGLSLNFEVNYSSIYKTELKLEDEIINFITEDDFYRKKIGELLSEINNKLKSINSSIDDNLKEYFEDVIYGHYINTEESFGQISVVEFIVNKLINELNMLNIGWKSNNLELLITMCSKQKTLYNFQPNKEAQFYILYPVLNSYSEWKIIIRNELTKSKNSTSFSSNKLFYIHCLNEYKRLTGTDYYINYCSENLYREGNYTLINDMIEWIENLSVDNSSLSYNLLIFTRLFLLQPV